MKKMKKSLAFVLALILVFTVIPTQSAQAAVKINKTKATIYVGKTVQLKLSGASSVKWSTSNKKVATVTSKGKVKGIKAGTATITATNKATKKSYTCKITVKKTKSFGYSSDNFWCQGNGEGFCYEGSLISGATYYLDGAKLTAEVWTNVEDGQTYSGVLFNEALTEQGEHTLKITKTGYTDFTWTFTYEPTTFDGLWASWDMFVENDVLYLGLNPVLWDDGYVKIDNGSINVKNSFINGDGEMVMWIDVSSLSSGEHTVSVWATGYEESSKTFTK